MNANNKPVTTYPYTVDTAGNIHQILTGLQGFGSMARELIQNADDAGAKKIHFSIERDCLRIWNNKPFRSCGLKNEKCPWKAKGRPGDRKLKACDFHAIGKIAYRNKLHDSSQIGRFGTGFVAVYQVTDNPIIRSKGIQLQLNPLSEEFSFSEIDEFEGSEFILPWAFDDSSEIRRELEISAITQADVDTIFDELRTLANNSLLFLRNLTSISIKHGKKTAKVNKIPHRKNREFGTQQVEVSYWPGNRRDNWYLIHCSANEEAEPLREEYESIKSQEPETKLQLAFKLSGQKEWIGRLYAYLPTERDSPVPCHINADFYPKSDRTDLILSEGHHELHWNLMLLKVAAEGISNYILQLRDVLGAVGLWSIINKAYIHRNSEQFGCFWEAIKEGVSENDVLLTTQNTWIRCDSGKLPPKGTSKKEEQALTQITIDLVHPSLHSYQEVLIELGLEVLSLESVVDALTHWDNARLADDAAGRKSPPRALFRHLWSVTNSLVPKNIESNESLDKTRLRLQEIRFVPKVNQSSVQNERAFVSINELYRLPPRKKNKQVLHHFPDLPLVEEQFKNFRNLYELIDILTLNSLLIEFSNRAADQDKAAAYIGSDIQRVRGLYGFLATYESNDDSVEAVTIETVVDIPILAGREGVFFKPNEALLPGGFDDPIGKIKSLDTRYYDKASQKFLKKTLGVEPLTLKSYVKNHLVEIFGDELSPDQHKILFDQLVINRSRLIDPEILEILRALPLVKTLDGELRRAQECYLKTHALVTLLGKRKPLWVDESIIHKSRTRKARTFLKDIGILEEPSLEHILVRIQEITDGHPSKKLRTMVFRLLYFLARKLDEYSAKGTRGIFEYALGELRNIEWLPASTDGDLDTSRWYTPDSIYQHMHSRDFDSHVPVLDITTDNKHPSVNQFLDFLGMPKVPETSVIVDYFIKCSKKGNRASELAYKVLNDKFNEYDDRPSIARLTDEKIIYIRDHNAFQSPDRVFWKMPGLGKYCFKAPAWMGDYKEMFEYLGVEESPNDATYVGILIEIANSYGEQSLSFPVKEKLVYRKCLDALSSHAKEMQPHEFTEIDRLSSYPFLLTYANKLSRPNNVAINDNSLLASHFGQKLSKHLIEQVTEHESLFERFDIRPLSSFISLETVNVTNERFDEEATDLIRERKELLQFLYAGNGDIDVEAVHNVLSLIEVIYVDKIEARYAFNHPSVQKYSKPHKPIIHFDSSKNKIFVHQSSESDFWKLAIKGIFSSMISGNDTPDGLLAYVAKDIMSAPTLEDARKVLHEADVGTSPKQEIEIDTQDDSDKSDTGPEEDFTEHAKGGNDSLSAQSGGGASTSGSKDDGDGGRTKRTKQQARAASSESGRTKGKQSGSRKAKSTSTNRKDPGRRMPTSILPKSEKTIGRSKLTPEQRKRNTETDKAAMKAVIQWEKECGRSAKPMGQNNPGYDIISISRSTNERRMIEVKGIDGEWGEPGVKLSVTQIVHAKDYDDEYWVYVVEHARDKNKQDIHPIRNPFSKAVTEFWFGHTWKKHAKKE